MPEGVDIDQPADVSWQPEGAPDRKGSHFHALRSAINFVKTQLKYSEQRTAWIDFYSPPYRLDYGDPDVREKAAEALGIDLDCLLEVMAVEDSITITLPGTNYHTVYRRSQNGHPVRQSISAVDDESAPMSLEEFLAEAHGQALAKARRLGWV